MFSVAEFLFWKNRRRKRWKRKALAERQFFKCLLSLDKSDICIDCGSNRGDFTLHMLRTGATVHAFEPDPVPYSVIKKRLGHFDTLHLYQEAVSSSSGEAQLARSSEFHRCPLEASVASSIIEGEMDTKNTLTVATRSLTDFIKKLPKPPSILKMDIEGSEVDVLWALIEEGLVSEIPKIFVETHEANFPDLKKSTYDLITYCKGRSYNHINFDWD